MSYNSERFNLTNWKLTLPVDNKGDIQGEALEIKNLDKFESPYFYDAADGAMVFIAYTDGATTSGSTYPRAELREMNGDKRAAWNPSQGGTMTATLKVDEVPSFNNGKPGRLVVGQIHGADEELVRLYWENNTVYFINDRAGPQNKEIKFNLLSADGKTPDIALGEKFSYKIDARGDTLKIEVHADGKVYTSTTPINAVWQSDSLYFKAGVYLATNDDSGAGRAKVSFYGLDFGHTPGSGLGGLSPSKPDGNNPPPDPDVITGTKGSDPIDGTSGDDRVQAGAGNDIVRGQGGNDTIHGEDGDDKLYGVAGNDTLLGGAGRDLIDGGKGNDVATGGEGADTFVVSRGDGGLRITDFAVTGAKDTLILKGYSNDMLKSASLKSSGSDVVLHLSDGATVTFEETSMAEMKLAIFKAYIGNTLNSFNPDGSTPPPDPDPLPPILIGLKATESNDLLIGADKTNDVISAKGGNDTVNGQDGNDRLNGDAGDDKLIGNDGNDTLNGGTGNDSLYGDDNSDTLLGGAGADKLFGGQGDDILNGGLGQDQLSGGEGADVFVFNQTPDIYDIITDFNVAEDTIDLSGLLSENGFVTIKPVSGGDGLYVDPDGRGGTAKEMLLAVFKTDISAEELKDILG